MLRLVVTNQRGGDAKTTTTIALADFFAQEGKRVLVIDTDPQGSISVVMNVKAGDRSLHSFLIKGFRFEDCILHLSPSIDLLPSDRRTVETEAILMGNTARELTFRHVFPQVEKGYDVVLIDVAPSISLLQTCSMLYAEHLLIPASMDPLSLQGVVANIQTAKVLQDLFSIPIRPVAILPVKVDRRLAVTSKILQALENVSKDHGIPLLSAIRTDATVTKVSRSGKFLAEYAKDCKAQLDYTAAFTELAGVLEGHSNVAAIA
jgi:chromosome partitioning protein